MNMATKLISPLMALALFATSATLMAYPLDGYKDTGIRRVEGARMANEGLVRGSTQPSGATLTTEQVDLRLLNKSITLPTPDAQFSAEIKALLGENADRYGVAVLDLSDQDKPLYGEYRGDYRQNVGSVGKLLAALGLFQALADTWPDDLDRRTAVLRETVITADNFSNSDHHKIRVFNVEKKEMIRRTLTDGEQGSMWEYLDWMLSVSSNSAAAVLMRDAMLLKHFGKEYPVSEERIKTFFADTSRTELTELFQQTFWEPVTRNGLSLEQLRQGSFFTRQGKANVAGGGNSYATARSLMELLLKMEEGVLVDEWSSRQLKRLLYMTERRIRYASSPALKDAAVYFKSGSLYSCQKEEGFTCTPYHGNIRNYMTSVAIVEQETESAKLHYLVVVISNVLRQNSAVEHQTLGTRMHRLIERENTVVQP
jgi:hypothetical protein